MTAAPKTPGRPKGTRVTLCACGRRVTGQMGKFVRCPDCGKRVKIRQRGEKTKPMLVFLSAPRAQKSK